MLQQTLKALFSRDIKKLRQEISLYKSEQTLWQIDKEIANSGGNLCLHLAGNLNTYFGTVLGNTGYVRNRDLEFSQKNIPQAELLKMIDEVLPIVEKVLDHLTPEQLNEEYPMPVFEYAMTTEYFLVHLAMHLSYHLGQINYHRRLMSS